MTSMDFYLGNVYDLTAGRLPERVIYDAANLTTHAVITGMTGSGKTGLGIGILEEAALHQIPAIVIDLKGDLTNLLLHFPEQAAQDFEPWLDPEMARRAGKSLPQLAEEVAERWREGLAQSGLGREQLLALRDSVQFTIFTPGSSAGQPVNILASFHPPAPWEEYREILRERISSTVTALLTLVGVGQVDPLRSREHILLANLLEHAWSRGQGLDLNELILQVQSPPFERLGAFPLNSFFPEKDRFELAMLLNNFLAAPSFQTWMEGDALDVAALLFAADGRPRHNLFYLAHLSEGERMFFVTLLLAAVESWMRTQRGTSGLRLLMYLDEMVGYLPPVANPPSRPILLRMLKQARAFGVGLVLATQNPVDLDYKALANCGTWMIGRLQTDQDKQRLLDGLQSAGGEMDRAAYDRLISAQQKRVFLLHSVHLPKPVLFQTRWTLNYLAGPLTRAEIPHLKALAGANTVTTAPPIPTIETAPPAVVQSPAAVPKSLPTPVVTEGSQTRPAAPPGVSEYFLPNDLSIHQALAVSGSSVLQGPVQPLGIFYRPALFAQAEVRYLARKYGLETLNRLAVLVQEAEGSLMHWERWPWLTYEPAAIAGQPLPQARFAALPGWLGEGRSLAALKRDFVDWVYRTAIVRVRANEALKVYAGPQVSAADFRQQCADAARRGLQEALEKLQRAHEQKLLALRQKVQRQELEVREQQEEVRQRGLEEMGAHGELLLSVFSRRKRSLTTSLSKSRLTQRAKEMLKQEQQELETLEKQYQQLEAAYQAQVQAVQEQWARVAADESELPISPQKKDIALQAFGIAWLPYYQLLAGGQPLEVAAFRQALR